MDKSDSIDWTKVIRLVDKSDNKLYALYNDEL